MYNWLTYPDFTERYPGVALTEADFTPLATEAMFSIMEATHWRAAHAESKAEVEQLRECQAQLVQLNSGLDAAWDGVTSVNNHGYTESYASGTDRQVYLRQWQQQIIRQVLSAPDTRWMLYEGAVYRPPRRR